MAELTEFTTMWKYACAECGAVIEPRTQAWRRDTDGAVICTADKEAVQT